MKPAKSIAWQHLGPNPKSCYKQLFVNGTRIRARVIYGMHMSAEEPMSLEEIAGEFNLPLEAVKEAIAYCQSNPPEILQDLEREERLMQASGMNDPDYKYGGKFKVVSPEEVVRILKA
jgi:uncharacterized protein (DUF433 family)